MAARPIMRRLPFLAIASLLAACTPSATPAPQPPVTVNVPLAPTATLPPSASASPPAAPAERGHRLLVTTTGCWFGGVWRDALNEPADTDRCSLALELAYGTVDKIRLE